ncbi:Uncharacterised protein [Mycobacteroides abscessus subsp. massiliense]|nr:Uncharacterised protein [Mycobacteroides abscessus subsp. massiliense]
MKVLKLGQADAQTFHHRGGDAEGLLAKRGAPAGQGDVRGALIGGAAWAGDQSERFESLEHRGDGCRVGLQ